MTKDAEARKARADAITKQRQARYEADFTPHHTAGAHLQVEELRIANALEHIAFNIGRLRVALDEINEREKKRFEREKALHLSETQKSLTAKSREARRR